MQAGAAVIPDSCNHEHIVVLAQAQRPLQNVLGLPVGCLLPPADVDDVGPFLHGLLDGSGKIELRESAFAKIPEDGSYQPPALRRDTGDRAPRLTEDQACDVGTVNRHRTLASGILHQRVESPDVGASKAGVGQIHRAVQHSHAYLGIAECRTLRRPETGEHCPRIQRSIPPPSPEEVRRRLCSMWSGRCV